MADMWDDAKKLRCEFSARRGKSLTKARLCPRPGVSDSWVELLRETKSLMVALDAHEKKYDKYLAALRAQEDAINEDNLGLDPKNKEDAKKIVAARKPLVKYWNGVLQQGESDYSYVKKIKTSVKSIMEG